MILLLLIVLRQWISEYKEDVNMILCELCPLRVWVRVGRGVWNCHRNRYVEKRVHLDCLRSVKRVSLFSCVSEHKPHWSTVRFVKSVRKQDGVTNEIEHRHNANVPWPNAPIERLGHLLRVRKAEDSNLDWNQQSCKTISMGLLSLCRQILKQYPKLGHDHSLPHYFQYNIHWSTTFRRHIDLATDSVVKWT